MKELVSIETGKGRRKKTRVFFCGQEILSRSDLSKENQGKRLASKQPIYGDEKKKYDPMDGKSREYVSYENINGQADGCLGSIVESDRQKTNEVEYGDIEDQIILSQKNEAKEAKMAGTPIVRRVK